jgi:hypothetical protein
MKEKAVNKVVWHIRSFLEWGESVLELFPALWDAAKTFAPLVVDFCDICRKPVTVLWIPVGDHDVCDVLQDPQDTGALYVNKSPLPPL